MGFSEKVDPTSMKTFLLVCVIASMLLAVVQQRTIETQQVQLNELLVSMNQLMAADERLKQADDRLMKASQELISGQNQRLVQCGLGSLFGDRIALWKGW